jgi:hypothetical protein
LLGSTATISSGSAPCSTGCCLSRTPISRADAARTDAGGSYVIARSPWSARQTPTMLPARASSTFSNIIAGLRRARNANKNKTRIDPRQQTLLRRQERVRRRSRSRGLRRLGNSHRSSAEGDGRHTYIRANVQSTQLGPRARDARPCFRWRCGPYVETHHSLRRYVS